VTAQASVQKAEATVPVTVTPTVTPTKKGGLKKRGTPSHRKGAKAAAAAGDDEKPEILEVKKPEILEVKSNVDEGGDGNSSAAGAREPSCPESAVSVCDVTTDPLLGWMRNPNGRWVRGSRRVSGPKSRRGRRPKEPKNTTEGALSESGCTSESVVSVAINSSGSSDKLVGNSTSATESDVKLPDSATESSVKSLPTTNQKRSRQKERNTIDLSETDPEAKSDKPLQPNGPKAEVKAEPVTGSVKRRGRPAKKSLSLPKVLDRSESEDKRPVAGKKRSRSSAVGLPSKRPKISGDPEGLGDPDSTDVPKKDNDLTADEGPKILQESNQVGKDTKAKEEDEVGKGKDDSAKKDLPHSTIDKNTAENKEASSKSSEEDVPLRSRKMLGPKSRRKVAPASPSSESSPSSLSSSPPVGKPAKKTSPVKSSVDNEMEQLFFCYTCKTIYVSAAAKKRHEDEVHGK